MPGCKPRRCSVCAGQCLVHVKMMLSVCQGVSTLCWNDAECAHVVPDVYQEMPRRVMVPDVCWGMFGVCKGNNECILGGAWEGDDAGCVPG